MNILIEGWRGINHSFSLVNQWQIIELSKSCNIFFKDVPFASKKWDNKKNYSGLEKNLSILINNILNPKKTKYTILLIEYPLLLILIIFLNQKFYLFLVIVHTKF